MDLATGEDVEAGSGFVLVRAPRNGDLPRDYLRTFEIVGRDGLAHLTYGVRKVAHVFDSRRDPEDVVRRLRRRAAIGTYDYLVQGFVGQASVAPA